MKQVKIGKATLLVPNVYGPNVSHGVVSRFIEDEKHSRPDNQMPRGITIYGDGTQTRDFVYELDLARAIEEAGSWDEGDYYIGTGIQTPVFEVFRLLTFIWGYTPKRDFVSFPDGEEPIQVPITSSGLPWGAKELEEGLRLTVAATL